MCPVTATARPSSGTRVTTRTDHRPVPQGGHPVPQQAGRFSAGAGHASRMGLRGRPPAGALALPVGRHPRLPATIRQPRTRYRWRRAGRPSGTVYKEVAGKPPVLNVRYYKPTNKDGRPFMPVEFAVAAYRFAHSIIRPFYVINGSGIVDIFGPEGFNLNGGRPIPSTWSSCGTTSCPIWATRLLARRARSTPSCRCR